jgi:hypothetical protein
MTWNIVLWYAFLTLMMVGISVMYFLSDKSGAALLGRVITSAHGAVLAIIFCSAVLINLTGNAGSKFAEIIFLSHSLPLVLIAISLIWYRGPRNVHLVQPFLVLFVLLSAFIGSMTAGGAVF